MSFRVSFLGSFLDRDSRDVYVDEGRSCSRFFLPLKRSRFKIRLLGTNLKASPVLTFGFEI